MMQNLLDVTPEIKPIPPPLNMQNLLMMQELRTMPPPRLQQLNYEQDYYKLTGGLQQLNGDDEMAMADMGLQQLSTTGVFNVAKDAMDLQQLLKVTRGMWCVKHGYSVILI